MRRTPPGARAGQRPVRANAAQLASRRDGATRSSARGPERMENAEPRTGPAGNKVPIRDTGVRSSLNLPGRPCGGAVPCGLPVLISGSPGRQCPLPADALPAIGRKTNRPETRCQALKSRPRRGTARPRTRAGLRPAKGCARQMRNPERIGLPPRCCCPQRIVPRQEVRPVSGVLSGTITAAPSPHPAQDCDPATRQRFRKGHCACTWISQPRRSPSIVQPFGPGDRLSATACLPAPGEAPAPARSRAPEAERQGENPSVARNSGPIRLREGLPGNR